MNGTTHRPDWHLDAVLYQLHVKAFRDSNSNSDGFGDFLGLSQKLDYIKQPAVNCIWLLPFYPSPLKDDGYDIAHCTDIHPNYGSLQDFTAFIDAAHALTLEMVTPEEREFMDGHYAKDARMRINVGIRRRLAPLMDNGRDETRQ